METTSRVGPEQKKKKSQILDSMETTFPLRLEGVATKQPLVLFFGRSFDKPFHFHYNAQEPEHKVVLGFLSGYAVVLNRK